MKSLKNLKPYNEERKRKLGSNAQYVHIPEHLPQLLQRQNKLLHIFKKAREAGKKCCGELNKQRIDNVKHHKDNSDSDGSSSDSSASSE